MQLVHTKSLVKFAISAFPFMRVAGDPEPKACIIWQHLYAVIIGNWRVPYIWKKYAAKSKAWCLLHSALNYSYASEPRLGIRCSLGYGSLLVFSYSRERHGIWQWQWQRNAASHPCAVRAGASMTWSKFRCFLFIAICSGTRLRKRASR